MPTTNKNKSKKASPKKHSKYHPVDYRYLSEKGYTDEEIIAIWDRDIERGHTEPQTHGAVINHPAFKGIY